LPLRVAEISPLGPSTETIRFKSLLRTDRNASNQLEITPNGTAYALRLQHPPLNANQIEDTPILTKDREKEYALHLQHPPLHGDTTNETEDSKY